ncbi:hypothetical protein [Rhizobium sp. TRM95796]|uniref:hypothetical protein n=1 Tax=Rhizobium sp. TRM95796 TaxID=2979862 RepID=UPI0021E8BCE4|nr:hypothetical protein [Rhizobium sp. TRM95796]MCV3766689.1 hypothetical protein [Rhizobium sp. TRM95796]
MESKYQHHGTALYGKRAVAIWLLIGVLPLLVQISGNNFLPSPAWIRDVRDLAMLVGIGTGGFTVWLIVSSVSQSSSNELKKVIAVIASPVLGYCLGATVVNIAVPMVMAIVFGGPVEMAYVVDQARDADEKYCRSSVTFQGAPFPFDRVCGVSDTFRKTLQPGTNIVATGRGTKYGLFVSDLEKAK